MGKNRSKNKRKQEKQARKEKEQEEKLKLDKKEENDLKYSNNELVSCPESDNQFVKENWDDEGDDNWEEVVRKKRLKNQEKNVESMEVDDKPSTKNRKKNVQMNSLQGSANNMECGENDWPENPPSRAASSRERHRNRSSNRRTDSRSRDCDNSSHRRRDNLRHRHCDQYREDNFNNRSSRNNSDYQSYDHKSPTKHREKGKQMNSYQDLGHNMKCAEKDWPANPSRRKDSSRERDRSHSSHRRTDSRNRNVVKDRPFDHQRETRNNDDRFQRGHSNNRSLKTRYQDKKTSHRRQGQENQNSFEKGNKIHDKRNTHQIDHLRRSRWEQVPQSNNFVKSKKKLFVPNADHYEPTIRELEGNLFESSEEYSLAHCIAEDLLMGAGIAVEFKKRFKGVQQLLQQDKRVGEVAILQRDRRFIFYMITKRLSCRKPTIESISTAIKSLKQSCLELNVKKLAIPRIGCGLDRLDWGEVKNILYDEFSTTDIEIVVYVW